MEGLLPTTEFAKLTASRLGAEKFTLFDIGCSGGIDLAWRSFGDRLRAFGFDPNLQECERLKAEETFPDVHYVPSFVGSRSDDEFSDMRGQRPLLAGNPWDRLSTVRSLEIRRAASEMTAEQLRDHNLWQNTILADAGSPVILANFAKDNNISDVDFIKIDVDGEDFLILNSLTTGLSTWNVLGVGLEVNFFGTDYPTDHSFHNMDRFMRRQGFDLFNLTIRRYSLAAIPSIYEWHNPAKTRTGRPLQGDAVYLRDICAPTKHGLDDGSARSLAKILKLAAIASLIGLPDYAGEIISDRREQLHGVLDVPAALDLLTSQAQDQDGTGTNLSYHDYMGAFAADDPMFYSKAVNPSDEALMVATDAGMRATDAHIQELKDQVAALKNSTSWRVTAPLRLLSGLIRGSRR